MSPSHAASDETAGPRLRLGDLLIASNELSPQQVEEVLKAQAAHGGRFGDLAIALGFVSREGIDRALARQAPAPEPEPEPEPEPDPAPTLRLGDLLVASSAMSPSQVERVLEAQESSSLRFGELAVALGFVTPDDIEHALARQSGPDASAGGNPAWQALAGRIDSGSPLALQMASLHLRLADLGFGQATARRTLAVAAAGRPGEAAEAGAHLAVRFAREGRRTLLLEADLRSNTVAGLFGLHAGIDLARLLDTGSGIDSLASFAGQSLLTILPCTGTIADPLGKLSAATFTQLIEQLRLQFDVVVVIAPAGNHPAESQIACQACGAALIVGDGADESADAARVLASILSRSGVAVVGKVRTGD